MTIDVSLPGTYTVTAVDTNTGCQSEASVEVIFYDIVTPIIAVEDNILTSSEAEAYQWYLDGVPIPNATGMTYEVTASGNYQVETFDINGCSSFSGVVNVEISSVAGISQLDQFELFPNPVRDQLTLSLSTLESLDLDLNVYNQLGQKLFTQTITQSGDNQYPISVANLVPGLYYLSLVSDTGGVETLRFVKE